MKTVHEVSKETGISIRTLHYYDEIGLLSPDGVTESGYRLYGPTAMKRLGQILFFRALEFPLKEIKKILDAPSFDSSQALEQQITLLTMRRERLDRLITLALEIQKKGESAMDFHTFDTSKADCYAEEVKRRWQNTKPYQEFQEKTNYSSKQDSKGSNGELASQFDRFSKLLNMPYDAPVVQAEVKRLQQIITKNYYTCTDEILTSLGAMYTEDERFRKYIDSFAPGTAAFAGKAISHYCQNNHI